MASKELGEDRIKELKSSRSQSGEVEVEWVILRERWCAEFLGLMIEGNDGMSLIPEPR